MCNPAQAKYRQEDCGGLQIVPESLTKTADSLLCLCKTHYSSKNTVFFFFSSSSSFFSPSASVTDREGKEGRGLLSIWVVLLRFLSAECLVMLAEAKGERRESQSEEMG